jgi:hypothetical protein
MKTLFYTLVAAFTFAFGSLAADTLVVDITKLSPSELALYQKLKSDQLAEANTFNIDRVTPDQIDRYGQIGRAFGSAFKECWTAVSSDAEKFAQSDAGKWAMFLVAWKIMGQDAINVIDSIVRYIAGFFLLGVGIPFFIYIFRRNCVQYPMLVSRTRVGFWSIKSEYKGVVAPLHPAEGQILYGLSFLIYMVIVSFIMFMF